MFLQVSVCPRGVPSSGSGRESVSGSRGCLSLALEVSGFGGAHSPPLGRDPPGKPTSHKTKKATAADDTHPTGMHSCYVIAIAVIIRLKYRLSTHFVRLRLRLLSPKEKNRNRIINHRCEWPIIQKLFLRTIRRVAAGKEFTSYHSHSRDQNHFNVNSDGFNMGLAPWGPKFL